MANSSKSNSEDDNNYTSIGIKVKTKQILDFWIGEGKSADRGIRELLEIATQKPFDELNEEYFKNNKMGGGAHGTY